MTPTILTSDGKPKFNEIDQDMTRYVMVLKETSGLATPALKWGALAALSRVDIAIYNIEAKKLIFKEKIETLGASNDDIDGALDSPDTFVNGYPKAAASLSYFLYWRLNRNNVFHELAKGSDLQIEFPSIQQLLNEYSNRFEFERPKKSKGWKHLKTHSSYLYQSEPIKDKKRFGISSDIDLLVKELGQDFKTLTNYMDLRMSRLIDLGWDASSIKDVPVLKFNGHWDSYMLARPSGGYSIFLHRKQEKFVLTHEIIVLEDDPIPLLIKHQDEIQKYVNASSLTIK